MKKLIIFAMTVIILGIINWVIAIQFQSSVFDLSIPIGVGAIILSYILTNKSGNAIRIYDRQIQGETGMKVEVTNGRVSSTTKSSPILIASIVYTVCSLLAIFYVYRDYFNN